jgi:dihydroorotate dehydrogenase
MELRGVNFGPVSAASGALNNGEGYRYHNRIKKLPGRLSSGFDFARATPVMKTGTLDPNAGNMPLDDQFQPKELFPRCIYVNHLLQIALNAVSLSNPGMNALLEAGRWQAQLNPFWISFMPNRGTPEQVQLRLDETESFARLLLHFCLTTKFKSRFGVQLNVSCPNTKHDPFKMANEAIGLGRVLRSILGDIPLDLKINAMTPIKAVKLIQESGVFDSITCSNTIQWGMLPEKIHWRWISPSGVSPLIKRGFKQPGGLSGKWLLPINETWIKEARADGVTLPITACGGILCPDDVDRMEYAGADAIALGSIFFLRWWNVKPCIDRAYQLAERRWR